MAKLRSLVDSNGNKIYPVTYTDVVYDTTGTALTNVIGKDTLTTTSQTVKGAINELKSNFQAGVDGVYDAIVAQGTTPASKSLSDVEAGIATLSSDRYSDGETDYKPTEVDVAKDGTVSAINAAGTSVLSTTTENSYNNGYSSGETTGQATAKAEYEPTDATLSNAGVLSVKNVSGVEKYTETFENSYDAGVTDTKVGTAGASDVLSGKTFTNSTTVGETGTMANNGAVSQTLDTTTTSYDVPIGYHNGAGKVSVTTQTKSATPSTEEQTISADSGKVLSSVTVAAMTTGALNNTATTGVEYTEDTSAQTEIPAEGALYINAGYYPNTKITLGHLIPDDPGYDDAGVSEIRSGYEAYDTAGNKLIGTLADVVPAFTGGTPSLTGTSNEITTNMSTAENSSYYIDAEAKAKATRGDVTYSQNATGYVDKKSGDVASASATSDEGTIDATRVYIPASTIPNPTINVSDGGLITASSTSTSGYNPGGTASNTKQLSTVAETTYPLSTSDRTISAGQYITGNQTIKGVSGGELTLTDVASGVDCLNYSSVTTDGLVKPTTIVKTKGQTYSLSTTDKEIAGGTYFETSATIKGVTGGTLTLTDVATETNCLNYSKVSTSGLMKTPTGSQTITENGTYDVTNLATLIASISSGGGFSYSNVEFKNIAASTTNVGTISLTNPTKCLFICADRSTSSLYNLDADLYVPNDDLKAYYFNIRNTSSDPVEYTIGSSTSSGYITSVSDDLKTINTKTSSGIRLLAISFY